MRNTWRTLWAGLVWVVPLWGCESEQFDGEMSDDASFASEGGLEESPFEEPSLEQASHVESSACTRTGESWICPLRSGTTTYQNGGGVLRQVSLVNQTDGPMFVERIDATRAPGQPTWQEVGVFRCRVADGAGCALDPPGQIEHGLGEVHYLNALPGTGTFAPEARFDGFSSKLVIEPGHYVLVNSGGLVGGTITVRATSSMDAQPAQSWRLPRRDVNHGASLNVCSGGVDHLLDWGVGKNNPTGFNHFWTNDTGRNLTVGSVGVGVTNGGPSFTPLTHGACLYQYDPAGALVAQSCVPNGDGLYWFGWGFPAGNTIALQAHNQCEPGNVWNMVLNLHVF